MRNNIRSDVKFFLVVAYGVAIYLIVSRIVEIWR